MNGLRLAAIVTIVLLSVACADPPGLPGPQGTRYLRPPLPHYPFTMREAGIEGRVVLLVAIGRDGTPQSVEVAQSSGHGAFDQEAVTAMRLAKFLPPATEMRVLAPVVFSLK